MMTGFAWLLDEGSKIKDKSMIGWLYFRQFLAFDMQTFAEEVSKYSKSHFDIAVSPDSVDLPFSAALYDEVMLYAHAATKVLSKGGDLQDGTAVTEVVRNTTFEGIGGTAVALDSQGDSITSYEVMNFVLEAGDVLSSVAVGMFNSTLQQYKAYDRAVVWPGNATLAPRDHLPGNSCCNS